jgi:hypothetical protein
MTDREPCPAIVTVHGDDYACDDVIDHYGVHTHMRTWWPNERAGDPRCDTPSCTLYKPHRGLHHIKATPTEPDDLPF